VGFRFDEIVERAAAEEKAVGGERTKHAPTKRRENVEEPLVLERLATAEGNSSDLTRRHAVTDERDHFLRRPRGRAARTARAVTERAGFLAHVGELQRDALDAQSGADSMGHAGRLVSHGWIPLTRRDMADDWAQSGDRLRLNSFTTLRVRSHTRTTPRHR